MKAYSLKQREYVLESEKKLPASEQSVFVCKFPSVEVQELITDIGLNAEGGMGKMKAGDFNIIVKDCLQEVKNFDVDDKKISIKKGDDNFLDMIPIQAKIEIATAIINECFLTDKQVKN